MSYLVLARKWRPQRFEDLIGQEPIVRVLKNSIERGKIAHAYLFSGPRGVGKTSTARILAKSLNCENGPTPVPCGRCSSCVSITDGSSVDVMEIDGASNNSVNDIRDLRERVKYVPSGGRFKVYIIDETHMLSDAAFNALLKTLEEPPSHVVFVLATTASKKIPPTVLSRCQHLVFRRIPGQQIGQRLKSISDSEGISVSDSALEMIARAADGSLRDALTILDQISSFTSDIGKSDIKDLLGITDCETLLQLASAIIEGKREDIIRISAELIEKGTDIRAFTRELIQFFRDMLVISVVKNPEELLEISKEDIKELKHLSRSTSEDHLMLILSELLKAEVELRNSSAPRLAFEMSLLKISFLSEMKPLREVIDNIGAYIKNDTDREMPKTYENPVSKTVEEPVSKKLSGTETDSAFNHSGEAIKSATESAFVEESTKRVQTADAQLDEQILDRVFRKMESPLSSKLSKATFNLSGDKLLLTLNGGYALFADSIKKNTETIERIFSEELGKQIRIEVNILKKKTVRKKDLKEQVMAEPTIQEVLELFDGRIVDVIPIKDENL